MFRTFPTDNRPDLLFSKGCFALYQAGFSNETGQRLFYVMLDRLCYFDYSSLIESEPNHVAWALNAYARHLIFKMGGMLDSTKGKFVERFVFASSKIQGDVKSLPNKYSQGEVKTLFQTVLGSPNNRALLLDIMTDLGLFDRAAESDQAWALYRIAHEWLYLIFAPENMERGPWEIYVARAIASQAFNPETLEIKRNRFFTDARANPDKELSAEDDPIADALALQKAEEKPA